VFQLILVMFFHGKTKKSNQTRLLKKNLDSSRSKAKGKIRGSSTAVGSECEGPWQLHPGRLTAGSPTAITHLERKIF